MFNIIRAERIASESGEIEVLDVWLPADGHRDLSQRLGAPSMRDGRAIYHVGRAVVARSGGRLRFLVFAVKALEGTEMFELGIDLESFFGAPTYPHQWTRSRGSFVCDEVVHSAASLLNAAARDVK